MPRGTRARSAKRRPMIRTASAGPTCSTGRTRLRSLTRSGRRRAGFARSAVLRHRRCGDRPRRGHLRLHAHRARSTASSRSATSTSRRGSRRHARGDRSHVPADGQCLRAGLSPLRVEMRQLQSAVARRGHAFRLHLRRPVPPGHRQQGPQSRYHLVRHHRRATGTADSGTPIYAGSIRRTSTRRARRSRSCRSSPRPSCAGFGRCWPPLQRLQVRKPDTCRATSSGALSSTCCPGPAGRPPWRPPPAG